MENEMWRYRSQNELYHHGILGMKWGVRRYQNKDGSLTPAGKSRYTKTEEEKTETLEETRARILKSTDAKEIYEHRNLLTTSEINERLTRIDTEQKLAKIAESTKNSGKQRVDNALKTSADTIGNATNLFKKVDDAYSTVLNSAMGKTLAKKLGIEPPKKEFNLDEFWKNRKTKTDEEIQKVRQRVMDEKIIENEMERRKNSSSNRTTTVTSTIINTNLDDVNESTVSSGREYVDRVLSETQRNDDH